MRQYSKPCIKIREIAIESNMMTDSLPFGNGEVDTNLTKGRRGAWGNLWYDDSVEEEER